MVFCPSILSHFCRHTWKRPKLKTQTILQCLLSSASPWLIDVDRWDLKGSQEPLYVCDVSSCGPLRHPFLGRCVHVLTRDTAFWCLPTCFKTSLPKPLAVLAPFAVASSSTLYCVSKLLSEKLGTIPTDSHLPSVWTFLAEMSCRWSPN